MIGTEDAAALALAGSLTQIGEGCSRIVYMRDGIVYKVENGKPESIGANQSEYCAATLLKGETPYPFTVPPVYLHNNGVLAMPYYEGILMGECCGEENCTYEDCMPEDIWQIANTIGPDIVTWGNTIRLENGTYVLIDLA